ncbi:enoyl-ACP reductase FabI [Halonatronum saccharophilum]|uniref:enoyl-ACP reductase FabI n=1 Tax=Halonatronum saccharophilum TaxID=150060 RepID=UPI0004800DDE|nr:enoyl-ACP reductase [Halonatronum saccharophilum]
MSKGLMEGKKGLIMGVANDKSIAWKVAEKLKEQGAELAFSYQDESVKEKVVPLFEDIGSKHYYELNVLDDQNFEDVFERIKDEFGSLDFLVHSIAGGPDKDDLKGLYLDTSRDNFIRSMEISVYSFVKAVGLASPILKEGSSAITMTYYGGEKVLPNYNIMGVAKAALESSVRYLAKDLGQREIRVNALSPGPVLTRAASGIGDFRTLLKDFSQRAPMKRLVEKEEIAGSALYLLSELSSGVSGEILHVDCGYNIMG